MLRFKSRRPKRAAQRHVDHSRVDVDSLTRLTTTMWEARVTYTHGLSEWAETVRFTVLSWGESTLTILVTDHDFPGDRERRVLVPDHVDMEQFVLDYLIAGRW